MILNILESKKYRNPSGWGGYYVSDEVYTKLKKYRMVYVTTQETS